MQRNAVPLHFFKKLLAKDDHFSGGGGGGGEKGKEKHTCVDLHAKKEKPTFC